MNEYNLISYNHPYKKFKKVVVIKKENEDAVVLNVNYLRYAIQYKNRISLYRKKAS